MIAKIVVAGFIFAVAAVVGAYWWSNVPPDRPEGLAANSVWLWAPSVGLPSPKRGVWIGCSVQSREICRCKTSDKNGRTLFEGPFLSYEQNQLSESELAINVEQTQQHRIAEGVFIDRELVPLVYLKNGDILIPEAKYETSKRSLDASRHSR